MSDKKDVLDYLVATDPAFASALQLSQHALKLGMSDPATASALLACALVLLAVDAPNPKAFLAEAAKGLLHNPLTEDEPS